MSKNYLECNSKKTSYLWSLLFVLSSMSFGAFSQGTIQIGDGTASVGNFPINSCYGYNYSQQIYLANEFSNAVGIAGDITTLRFYYTTGGPTTANWTPTGMFTSVIH